MDEEVNDKLSVLTDKIDDLANQLFEHDERAKTICEDVAILKTAQVQNLEFQKGIQSTVTNIAQSQERQSKLSEDTQAQLKDLATITSATEQKREEFYQKELSRKNARAFVITKKRLVLYTGIMALAAAAIGAAVEILA